MVSKLLRKFAESIITRQDEKSTTPLASFQIIGFEDDGRVKVNFSFNSEFVKKIRSMGFDAETDEDRVQLFFFTSMMRPTTMQSDPTEEMVQSDAHPQLSSASNELRI